MGSSTGILRGYRTNWAAIAVAVFILAVTAGTQVVGRHAAYAADTGIDEIHTDFGDNAGTSMWVHWRGAAQTVFYGTTVSYGSTSSTSTTLPTTYTDTVNGVPTTIQVPVPTDPSVTGSQFQRVQLSPLTAGTIYHYKIGASGLDHTFKTAPTGDFTWDDIGDTGTTAFQTGAPTVCNKSWMSSVWSDVAADNPDLVTHGGDISYANACGDTNVHQFYQDYAPIATTRAVEQIWGNHEYGPVTSDAPTGTPSDVINNYKARSYIPNPVTVNNDNLTQHNQEGCAGGAPQLLTAADNGCRGSDWGSFTVGHVLFITAPEPWFQSYTDWQTGAAALMGAAQNNVNITMIVTISHRSAYTSLWDGLINNYADNLDLQAAINALGDQYGPSTANPGGKYVLEIGHHVHGAEVFAPQHNVWNVTDGGGGADTVASYSRSSHPGSLWNSAHFSHLNIQVTGATMHLKFICGPADPNNNSTSCTEGSTMNTTDISTAPYTPPPPATSCSSDIPAPGPGQYVSNTSLEQSQAPWTGTYSASTTNALNTNDVPNACDGYNSLKESVKTGSTVPVSIGLNASPAWVTNSIQGYTYTGKVHIKANVAGRLVHILIQQKNVTTGVTTSLGTASVTPANTTTWYTLNAGGASTENGDSILFKVYMDATATTDAFYADGLSLVSIAPPPPIPPQTVCQDIHSGDLISNRSVEANITGWTGVVTSASNVIVDGQAACDGSYSLKTTLLAGQSATTMGFNSSPSWVPSTTANTTYTGKVWVQSIAGKTIKLKIQEKAADGTTVSDLTKPITTDGNWDLITTSYVAVNNGDSLAFKVYMDSPLSTDAFSADNMSLLATPGVPPIGNQTLCSDTTASNETITNRSVESSLNGWEASNGNKTTISQDDTQACDGGHSLKIANNSGSTATSGIGFDSPADSPWVDSTITGATYSGSVWLKTTAGTQILVETRETKPTNMVGEQQIIYTAADANWHKVTVPVYTASQTGNWINFKVSIDTNAPDGAYFFADQMSLTTSSPVIAPFSHACDDSPTGTQAVLNRSAENDVTHVGDTTGWIGKYSAASQITTNGSASVAFCEGSFALQVINNTAAASNIGFQNTTTYGTNPYWIYNSTVAGHAYNASAWVRAATGTTVHVSICERDSTKTYACSTDNYVTINTGYHLRTVPTLLAAASGRSIQMKVYADNVAPNGYLDADNMSLTY